MNEIIQAVVQSGLGKKKKGGIFKREITDISVPEDESSQEVNASLSMLFIA